MKSIFNFRSLFIIFLGCITGVICFITLTDIKSRLGVFIAISILVLLILLYIVLGTINITKNNFFKYLSKTYKVLILFFLSLCIFGGIFSCAVKIKENKMVDINEEVTYSGKITNVTQKDNYVILELRNVTYNNGIENNKLNSHLKLCVYTTNFENFNIGNIVASKGKLTKLEIKNYSYYNYSALYSSRTSLNDVKITKGKPNLFESVKIKVSGILQKYMNLQNSQIAYTMLFGDKDDIDAEISNAFSIAGISHILAVSGLHIGVLVAILLFILKKFKTNEKVSFVVLFVILLFYMTLVGFTPSVVRASIMALVLTFSKIVGKRYDGLSSLSLAGIIILIFNPFQILSIGFQLSFACVFAIITLMPSISNMLVKLKFNKKFADILAISTATSLALVPFCAYYFNRITLLSVLSNILVVPIFSATYLFIFVLTFFSLILNFVGYLLVIPDVLIHIIKIIANFVAELKFSTIVVFDVSIISFISILSAEYILQFMVGMPKLKMVLVTFLIAVFFVSTIFGSIPYVYRLNSIVCFKQYDSNMVITTYDNGETCLVGLGDSEYYLEKVLVNYRINKLDNIILYENPTNINFVNNIVLKYNVNKVYIPKEYYNNKIKNAIMVDYNNDFYIANIKYNYVVNDANVYGVNFVRYGMNNFIGNNLSKNQLVTVSNIIGYDINMICIADVSFDLKTIFNYNVLVTQKDGNFETLNLDSKETFISYI